MNLKHIKIRLKAMALISSFCVMQDQLARINDLYVIIGLC